MKHTRRYMTMAGMVAAVLLASCVKDDLYNTPHPDKGAVVITTDWTDALAESTVPGTYLLRMDDGKAVPTSEKTTVYPELLTPVAHTLLIYNEPEGITIASNVATVQQKDGMLIPLPGYLFSAEKRLDIVQDDTLHVSVPMERRLCPGGESLTARLDVLRAEAKARATDAMALEMKCRVTGTAQGERQILTVKVTMADGYVSTITSDLTEHLKDLNADMEPVRLEGSIEAPQDGHFSGTIEGWEEVDGGDTDAN